jgi:hypothetical protein
LNVVPQHNHVEYKTERASRSSFKGIAHKRGDRLPAGEYFLAGKSASSRDWYDDALFHCNLWTTSHIQFAISV